MKTIDFATINAEVAAFHAQEAARNAPLAVARRAVFTLTSALADLSDAEDWEIREMLRAEMADMTRLTD